MFENRAVTKTNFNRYDFHLLSMIGIAFVCNRRHLKHLSVSSIFSQVLRNHGFDFLHARLSLLIRKLNKRSSLPEQQVHPFRRTDLSSLSFSLVYVLPPMANRRKKLFSVAALLAHGYASFKNDQSNRLYSDDSIDRHFSPGNRQSNTVSSPFCCDLQPFLF
jgi:hypothetical protein